MILYIHVHGLNYLGNKWNSNRIEWRGREGGGEREREERRGEREREPAGLRKVRNTEL